jgi:hypothetical protein
MTTLSPNTPDNELSALVSVHVAGWRYTPSLPDFSTSANAVLPLLENWSTDSGVYVKINCYVGYNRKWEVIVTEKVGWCEHKAQEDKLSRAICFALLLATGKFEMEVKAIRNSNH